MKSTMTDDAEQQTSVTASAQCTCVDCGAALCIRQRTVSLALGHDESMYCLVCLGKQSDTSGENVLANIKEYVLSRQCFRKEWFKYTERASCPQPETCYLETCFKTD